MSELNSRDLGSMRPTNLLEGYKRESKETISLSGSGLLVAEKGITPDG